jgi:hypothetical protein
MDKKSDALLRNMLKNWANRQHPPENGRARLLWEATRLSRSKFDLSILFHRPAQYKSYPPSYTGEWPHTLFTWINENSFQLGIQTRIS